MFFDKLNALLTVVEFFVYDSSILNAFFRSSQNRESLNREFKQNSIKVKIDLEKAKIHSVGNKNKITFTIKNELIKRYKCYVEMEPPKLKLWFLTKKETFLFIGKNNTKYLDLEFMAE